MIVRHALEEAAHGDFGDEPRHLAAEAEMLAGAEAEMALRAAVDIEPVGIGKFAVVAVSGAERERDLVAGVDGLAVHDPSRVATRLKRCAEVLKRSNSSIAGATSAGSR